MSCNENYVVMKPSISKKKYVVMKNKIRLFLFILVSTTLSIYSCTPDPEGPENNGQKEKPYCYIENGVKVCYETPK